MTNGTARSPSPQLGAILPQGCLLAVGEPSLRVLQASINCEEMLGVVFDRLMSSSLEVVLDELQIQTIRERLEDDTWQLPRHMLRCCVARQEFDIFAHRSDGVLIFEFEKRAGPARDLLRLQSDLRSTLTRLQETLNLQTFFDLATSKIRKLTGFDRVMVYRFLADGSGWVFSESLDEGADQPPYLGQHYPASDVPEAARRALETTWLRHLPDLAYKPVPVLPGLNPETGRELDMSRALLRSLSPVCIRYLANMGARGSMVMTLFRDGKLWGFISCQHHRGPLYVPSEVRMICESMALLISMMMAAKEDQETQEQRTKVKAVQNALVDGLSKETDIGSAVLSQSAVLLELVRASGAASVIGGKVERCGTTPSAREIISLAEWLSGNVVDEVFATDSLAGLISEAESYREVASGLLAIRLATQRNDYLMWFRPEQIKTRAWAGPTKTVAVSEEDGIPRSSFRVWQETIQLRSEPWLEMETGAAADLRTSISELLARRADKLGRLFADLERSHDQLDAFAYAASHDLKEPLRAIANYALMLSEDFADRLNEEGKERLTTIVRLSRRMDDLLDSLLEYSRVDREDFDKVEVDMNEVAADALESLSARIESQKTEIRIPACLPVVRGDYHRLSEVLLNLISNAVKYNDKEEKWVEVGVESGGEKARPVFYVRDNGIGIRAEHTEQIFQIFRRLHGRDQHGGGAGAGLTIAKKIIERHGGRIWVESKPGFGSTFRFSLSA